MISSLAAIVAFVVTPACFAQSAPQPSPSPAPVRAITASALRVEPNDIKQVVRQAPDAAPQPSPPAMMMIPAGSTIVGTDPSKVPELGDNAQSKMRDVVAETPRHTAKIDAFYIDRTEVTNLQWKTYLDATHRKPSPTLVQYNWPDAKIPEGEDQYPVTNVNIPEIRDFLHWCGKRLPTEEEWTRAARGDDDRIYSWGKEWSGGKLCRSGVAGGTTGPVAVGSFPAGASPYDVLDMTGNVFEWVDTPFRSFDGFTPYDIKQGKKSVPLTPSFDSTQKIIKGGSFANVRLDSRIDVRLGKNAPDSDAALGFRAARSEKTGVDVVRHALDRLLPPAFSKPGSIDLADVCCKEFNGYDETRRVITGYRYLAFAHRPVSRLPALSKLRDESINEPLPLGVLTTSEPMIMVDMPVPVGAAKHKADAVTLIAPGEFTLAFKGKGISKAYKEKQRLEKKASRKSKDKDDEKAEAEETSDDGGEPSPDDGSPGGAVVPWPGVGSIHDIQEDVDFPQESDVVLYYNANNVVVAWTKLEEIHEVDLAPTTLKGSDDGHTWTIEFSVEAVNSRKNARFTLPIHLGGDGLR